MRRGVANLPMHPHGHMWTFGPTSRSASLPVLERRSMSTRTDCLQLIEMVREAGEDPESAYLVRTRLRRALLGSARFATLASEAGRPPLPGNHAIPADASQAAAKVIDLCSQIHATTLRLCQPSEAFEARWK